jgi:hypothetical protein
MGSIDSGQSPWTARDEIWWGSIVSAIRETFDEYNRADYAEGHQALDDYLDGWILYRGRDHLEHARGDRQIAAWVALQTARAYWEGFENSLLGHVSRTYVGEDL